MIAGTRLVVDRLWPVLGVLVVLLVGASALEVIARERSGTDIVIEVHRDSAGASSGDDDDAAGEGEEGPTLDEVAPLDARHAEARLHARRGELEEALTLYERVVLEHPSDASVHAEQGYWLLVARKPEQALPALVRAAELRPTDTRIALNLGAARSRTGDTAGAEREYRRALARRPGFGAARVALGALLRRRGQLREARQTLLPATRTGSNDDRARALVALGRVHLAEHRPDRAARSFDDAIERQPAVAELRVRIGRAWLGTGERADAVRATEILARTAELAPDLAPVHSALGRARERIGDADGAQDAYERALRLDPSYRYVRRRLIRIALERRDFVRARAHAEHLMNDAPEEAEHHFLAGLVAARDGRTDAARTHYTDAIAHARGRYPEAFFNLGLLERGAGRPDASIEAYNHAIEQRPRYLAALNNLGLVLAAAGRHDEAEASYRRALAIDARYAAGWLNLGELLAARNQIDEALDAFRRAIAARGDYPEASLDLAVALGRAGRVDDSIRAYRALVTAHPRYVNARFNLAVALDQAGRSADARTELVRALEIDPDHVASRLRIARIDAAAGRLADARVAFEDVLDHEPGERGARLGLADVLRRLGDAAGCAREADIAHAAAPDAGTEAAVLAARCRGRATTPGGQP